MRTKTITLITVVFSVIFSSCDRLTNMFMADIYSQAANLQSEKTGLLVGGDFLSANGVPRVRLSRVNSEGTVDVDFDVSVDDGIVRSIAVTERQGETVILLGGSFTSVNGVASTGVAMVDLSGQIVGEFAPGIDDTGLVSVYRILPTDSETVLIGGDFTSVRGDGNRAYLFEATLDTGKVVSTFDPLVDDVVHDIAVGLDDGLLPDRYVIVGEFLTVGGETSMYGAAVDHQGAIVVTIPDIDPTMVMYTLSVDRENSMYVVGGNGFVASVSEQPGEWADGSAGMIFTSAADTPVPIGIVNAVAPLQGGIRLAGGSFTGVLYNGYTYPQANFFAYESSGEYIYWLYPTLNGSVYAMERAGEGVYIAGSFTEYDNGDGTIAPISSQIIYLGPQLVPEQTYTVSTDGTIYALATLADFE